MRAALVLVLLALAPALAAPAAPPVHLAPGTLAASGPLPQGVVSSGAEPMMLVAKSGALLVGDTSGLRRSTDGGASWTRSSDPFLDGLFADGWALAQDDAGTLYAATTQGQVIGVAASPDDGRTWTQVSPIVAAGGVADRPWLAANAAGHVALVWYQAGLGEWCASSTDGGVTFLGRSTNNFGISNAGNLVMDEAGDLWYATDFAIHRWRAGCQGTQEHVMLPPGGAQIFVQLALAPSGDVYVAQPAWGSTAMELRGMHGMDRTTLKRLAVSPPELRSNTFGAVAARDDGEIAVAWYGSTSPGSPGVESFRGEWHVYVARVRGYWTDAPTVEVTKVTATPNHRGWFCMSGVTCDSGRALLDYFGIAYDAAGNLHVAYGDDASGGGARVRHAIVPAA